MNNNYNMFKEGDVVLDFKGSVWGDVKFVVLGLSVNGQTAYVHEFGRPYTNRYRCNLFAKTMRLVGAEQRPLRKMNKVVLLRLVKKNVPEARREFNMRINNKEL